MQLLSRGYTVRATVRSRSNSSIVHLHSLGAALPGKLEIHEADLLQRGSYDSIVQGALYVCVSYTASMSSATIMRTLIYSCRPC